MICSTAGAEPAAWQVTASDATAALQGAGAVGFRSYVSSATTNGPLNIAVDDFRAVSAP